MKEDSILVAKALSKQGCWGDPEGILEVEWDGETHEVPRWVTFLGTAEDTILLLNSNNLYLV